MLFAYLNELTFIIEFLGKTLQLVFFLDTNNIPNLYNDIQSTDRVKLGNEQGTDVRVRFLIFIYVQCTAGKWGTGYRCKSTVSNIYLCKCTTGKW